MTQKPALVRDPVVGDLWCKSVINVTDHQKHSIAAPAVNGDIVVTIRDDYVLRHE